MKNKERPEVVDALIESMMDISLFSPNLYVLERFSKKMKAEFNSKREIDEWLNSEYVEPFKITQAETFVLENLHKYSKDSSIKRYASFGGIALSTPWDVYEMPFYNHLFDWIKEGEAYKIADILENCEVIDDEE